MSTPKTLSCGKGTQQHVYKQVVPRDLSAETLASNAEGLSYPQIKFNGKTTLCQMDLVPL